MPGKATLRYLPAAQEDLLSILEFIAKEARVEPFPSIDLMNTLDSLNIILSWGECLDTQNFESTVIVS